MLSSDDFVVEYKHHGWIGHRQSSLRELIEIKIPLNETDSFVERPVDILFHNSDT